MRRSIALTVLAVLTLGALTGCGNGVNTGPFGNGSPTRGGSCVPVRPGGVITDGLEEFRNMGKAVATIEKVSLYKPHDLSVMTAYVVPITGHTLYGWWAGYPTAAIAHKVRGVQWSHRQRADGAHIRPSPRSRNAVTNLLLVLKPTATVGTASAIDISYRESGQDYLWRSGFTIKVTKSHC